MHGKRPAGVLFLLLVALLLAASAYPAVGANGGRSVISDAAAKGTRASARLHTDTGSATLEDEVAPELSWVASHLGAGRSGIGYGTLHRNNPAVCQGPCLQPGQRYTGRPCASIYGCRNVPPK